MADYKQIQQKLNELGAQPPLTVDGAYGPRTRSAIIAFQSSRGLTADGVVGPKTLAALGLSGAAPSSSAASTMGFVLSPTVKKYYDLARNAALSAGYTEAQFQYGFTVAMGEGGFGEGWAHPSARTIAKSQKFGLTGYEGTGSNNWGATQGSGDVGSFPHVDSGWMIPDENGQPSNRHWQGNGPRVWGDYVAQYKKWSTPGKGFLDVMRTIFGGGHRGAAGAAAIKDAVARGNLTQAVYAQHANGYFELAPDKYLEAMLSNYSKLASGTGWKKLLGETGVQAGIGFFGLLVLGGIGYVIMRSRG